MKNYKFAFILSLILPGLGQIYTGRKLIGFLYAATALVFFSGALFEIVYPVYVTITGLLADPGHGEIRYINMLRFLFFLGGMIVLYIIAVADIALYARDRKQDIR